MSRGTAAKDAPWGRFSNGVGLRADHREGGSVPVRGTHEEAGQEETRHLRLSRLCFSLRRLISFRNKLLRHGLLEFLSIYAVAFGGVHENVVAACGGSPIRRIQKADFQKELAEFGIVIFADLLGQKLL